jgi:hypothetical protein
MALINPEILSLARVTVATTGGLSTGTYDFNNGLEGGTPTGAVAGSLPIYSSAPGSYVLFLDEAVDPGKPVTTSPAAPANQGGIKAVVDVVAVATASNTSTIGATITAAAQIEARWYYGDYSLPTAYVGVNPEKALHVNLYVAGSTALYSGNAQFDIVVFRNPMTIYKY